MSSWNCTLFLFTGDLGSISCKTRCLIMADLNKTKGKTIKLSRCVLLAVQGICRSGTLSEFKLIYFEPYNLDLCLILVVCLKGIDFSSAAKRNCFPHKFSLRACYLIACWISDVQFIESLPGPFDSLALQSIAPISWFFSYHWNKAN